MKIADNCNECRGRHIMEIPFKRVVWNEHETALLIEVYEKVRKGVVPRIQAVRQLSKRLRTPMILDRVAINDKYRNVVGMDLQLNSIERYMSNGNNGFGQIAISKVFERMILLKKEDKNRFDSILEEANILYPEVKEPLERKVLNENSQLDMAAEPNQDVDLVTKSPFDWNKYEAALLVDLYRQISNGILQKDIACQFVEKRFRNCSPVVNRNLIVSSEDFANALVDIEQYEKGELTAISEELENGVKLYNSHEMEFRELLYSAMILYPLENVSTFYNSSISKIKTTKSPVANYAKPREEKSVEYNKSINQPKKVDSITASFTYTQLKEINNIPSNEHSVSQEVMTLLKKEDKNKFDDILEEANILYPEVKEPLECKVLNENSQPEMASEPNQDVDLVTKSFFDWNKYEAVLLVNLYRQISNGILHKDEACQFVEKRFRNCSPEVNRSLVASSEDLANALVDIEQYEKGKLIAISEELENGVELYNNHEMEFRELLYSAMKLYPLENVLTFYSSSISNTETTKSPVANYAKPRETKSVEENKTINQPKKVDSITAPLNPRIKSLLVDKFKIGYRLGSNMDRKRFTNFYFTTYNEVLKLDGEALDNEISLCGVACKDKLYIPEIMLTKSTQEKLFDYISKQFENNIQCIYYDVLFKTFSDEFLGQKILDHSMLRAYLEYYDENEEYNFFPQYFSKESDISLDVNSEVINYVKKQGRSVFEDEVVSALSYIPEERIQVSFNGNKDILLTSGRGKRFHKANFQLEQEDKVNIINYLTQEIRDVKFLSFVELFDKMQSIAPRVVDNNIQFSETGIRSALSVLLGDLFYFRGGIISDIKNSISLQDAFKDFARGRNSFTMDEVQMLADDFNTVINFEALAFHNIRVSVNLYVDNGGVIFDIESIDNAIAKFCKGDFISISHIDTFAAFPECKYKWNEFLLESYLYLYSRTFQLFHNRFNKTSVSGAIVRKDSKYKDYNEVMAKALASSSIQLEKKSVVLDYLSENGFIVRRQLDEIEHVIKRAKQLKMN